MTRKFRILTAFSLLLAVVLSVASCEELDDDKLAVSVAKSSVSADAGSHLVYVECYLSWTLSLYSSDGDTDWASLSVTSGFGDSSVILSYEANDSTAARSLTIILASNGKETSCTFTQAGATSSSTGGGSSDGDEDEEDEEFVAPAWMELPALDNDELEFYTHSQTIGSTVTRNYSFYWDKNNLVAHWVAYPLNTWTIGTGSRTNAWGTLDPLVPEDEQPILASGFKSDGNVSYQRGHQIPSADRYYYEANVATFYGTNMTPQLGALNENLWANLESTVRSWAKSSDTLYVVTGCIVDGSTSVAYDNVGKEVTVPVAYFKALLRYSKASTIGYNGYLGAAFYLEHKGYSETNVTASMSMSIDDLEDLVGIDFFVNLPDAIGEDGAAYVERQQPSAYSWWGLSN